MPRKLREIKRVARKPWHGYILPGYDAQDGFPKYRFKWESFGEATFYESVDMSMQHVTSCCFSRAILSDTDLQSLINESTVASSSSTDLVSGVFETQLKADEGEYDSDEEIAREMAALDLPTSFGNPGRGKRNGRWRERKCRTDYIREKSPHHESLSHYLKCNGPYLERKSWFHDYPESFTTAEVAENFDKYTDQNYSPYALLKEHEQTSAFFGVSYAEIDHKNEDCSGCWFHLKMGSVENQVKDSSLDCEIEDSSADSGKRYPADGRDRYQTVDNLFRTDNNWNSLYLKHKEAVDNRIRKDYEKYTNESRKRRCLEFPDRLALVGLAYKGKASSADKSDDDYLETGVSKLERRHGFGIADVHYDFQIPYRFVPKSPKSHLHTNEIGNESEFTVVDVENALSPSYSALQDFDFGYNEKRDRRLLAINALKTFAHDKEMPKYYNQRFRLFSKLNEGILMDREGWYSVTPERIAAHIADRVVIMDGAVVLDGFAGVGGNCIQFALKGAYVIALDMNPVRLRCAKRNAEIYGVADRINFICIDFFNFCKFHCDKVKQLKMRVKEKHKSILCSVGYDASKLRKKQRMQRKVADDFEQIRKADKDDGYEVMEKIENGIIERNMLAETDTDGEDDFGIAVDNFHFRPFFDAVLLSPPWGGPSYLKSKLFSLKNMEPKGDKIFRITRKLTHNIAYFLPRQTDVKELIQLSKDTGGMVEIEQAEVNWKVKAITAYYGELASDAS